MRGFKWIATGVVGLGLATGCQIAAAAVSIDIGLAPQCPYGYYDAAPYQCAPSGYYGPEWFSGETFIGAGPWFHGPSNFRGNVNNRYHPSHGYTGPMPERGERAAPERRVDAAHFKGNEERDGRGNETGNRR
jgi:hypothetical protein